MLTTHENAQSEIGRLRKSVTLSVFINNHFIFFCEMQKYKIIRKRKLFHGKKYQIGGKKIVPASQSHT